jgi:2-polyprenyl-3-methyl-5-hydroxy-6-metoxy-1,4-benzoquinol methylase
MRKTPTKRERDTAKRFTQRYGERRGEAGAAIEREVIGVNVGLNGYTTVAQAERLARELRLRAGMRLLDLGAGNGWPGLHLAGTTGCHVVLADLPRPALVKASTRARRERLARRSNAVQATATSLPFAPESFDAIVHTDVMC